MSRSWLLLATIRTFEAWSGSAKDRPEEPLPPSRPQGILRIHSRTQKGASGTRKIPRPIRCESDPETCPSSWRVIIKCCFSITIIIIIIKSRINLLICATIYHHQTEANKTGVVNARMAIILRSHIYNNTFYLTRTTVQYCKLRAVAMSALLHTRASTMHGGEIILYNIFICKEREREKGSTGRRVKRIKHGT